MSPTVTGLLLAALVAASIVTILVYRARRHPGRAASPPPPGVTAEGDGEFLRQLLDNLSDAVVACDAQGRLVTFNQTARDWHGLSESPVGPGEWAQRYDLYSADGMTPLPTESIPLYRALQGEHVRNVQIAIAARGQPVRFVRVSGDPVLDTHGRKRGAVVVMRDVTDQRKSEEERLGTLRRIQGQQAALLRLSADQNLAEQDRAAAARVIAQTVMDAMELDACGVWLFSPDRRQLQCVARVDRRLGAATGELQLAVDAYPHYIRSLQSARTLEAGDASGDPRTAELANDYFQPRGIGATLDASIRIGSELVGVLCCEHRGGTRHWKPDEANFAAAAADQMAQCLIDQERKHTAESLRHSEQRYRALYDENPAMFFTVDPGGRIVSVNHFGASQLGYRMSELVGQPFTVIIPEGDRAAALLRLSSCLNSPASSVHRWEARQLRKDGSVLHVRETARLVEGPERQPQVFYVCEDITETHHLAEKLAYEASHDALTGLLNRWAFERQLREALEETRGSGRQHVLCYFDLDQFKVVNESSGHAVGDQLLKQVAGLLESQLAGRGVLARLGGDEFAILLRDYSLEQAERVAETWRKSLNNFRFQWEGRRFRTSASIGLVPVTRDSASVEQLLQAADAACYLAKDQGRDRVHVFSPDDTDLARRRSEIQWAAQIRSALEDNRLRLAMQTIVPVSGPSQGLHYELLMRLQDESGKLTTNAAFLSAAEHYGMATQLDMWVLNSALDWLARHPEHMRQLHLCSINLSGLSLGNEEFLDFLLRRCGDGRVPPAKLCFEITETAAIANLSQATEFIGRLKALGCSLALDDFGSGLSSYAYLRHLPVDFLKIDGAFVRGIADDPLDFALLRSMNEIGKLLGKQTIAEYVEDERILAKLREVGVDYAQGYAIAAPVLLDEVDRAGTG